MLTFGGQVLRRAYRLQSALQGVFDLRVTTCPSGSCDTHAWDKLPKIGASSLASPRATGIVTAGTINIGAFGARVDFARPKKRHPLDPPASDVVGGNQAIDVRGSAWTLTTQPPAPMHDRRAH